MSLPEDSSRRRQWLAGIALVGLTLAVFVAAMRGGILFDDYLFIFGNEVVRADNGLWYIWFTTTEVNYYPLSITSWWLEWRLWGADPAGYHVTNVVLHALSAVVLWRVLVMLKVPGAYLAAAVFAVHPVTTVSVAWISERKNTLSMLMFALSMLTYLRFEVEHRRALYFAAVGLFLLALLAKTSVVMMPVVLLLLAWWRRGRIGRADVLRAIPFFALSLLMGLTTIYTEYVNGIGPAVPRPEGFLSRLAAGGWCVWFYLYKVVCPIGLMMIYPRWNVIPSQPVAWLPLGALVTVGAALWPLRATWGRHVLFALGVFVAMLLPVLGFLNINFFRLSLVSDHFQYAAMIAPIALIIAGATVILRRLRAVVWLRAVLAAMLLVSLSLLTWREAALFESPKTLWGHNVRVNRNAWLAQYNLGRALLHEGDASAAVRHFREAVAVKPDYVQAHNNCGLALQAMGKPHEALESYRLAVKYEPKYADARVNWGSALHDLQRYDQAIEQYKMAVDIASDSAQAYVNWGAALLKLGKPKEAIARYREALRISPDHLDAHYSLGLALLLADQPEEAASHFRFVVSVSPYDIGALRKLSRAYASSGSYDRAIEVAETALRVATDETQRRAIEAQVQRYQSAGSPNGVEPTGKRQ